MKKDKAKERIRIRPEMLKFLAVFMSCLVIFIPFYVTSANAQVPLSESISITSVTGDDSISNYRKAADDFFEITAAASLGSYLSDPSSPSSVRIIYPGNNYPGPDVSMAFDSCTQRTSGGYVYDCAYKSPKSMMPYGPGIYPLTVCLTGQGRCSSDCSYCPPSCIGCKKTVNLFVDGRAPKINNFDITPKNTNGVGLTASYNVEDLLCSYAACLNKCSGLSRIEIINLGTGAVLKKVDLNTGINDCKRTGIVSFDIASASNGPASICIKAYDALGQASYESSNCIEVNKDSTSPVITVADLFDRNGMAPIRFVKQGGTQVKFIARITTSHLFSIDEAVADLTGFGLGERTLTCSGDTGVHTCEASFNLQVSGKTTASVRTDITDSGGNSVFKITLIEINLDDKPPVVDRLLTSRNYNNIGYLGPGLNDVFALINEIGVGMSGGDVWIAAPVGSSPVKASCSLREGSQWLCGISNVTATADLSVRVTGADDAGNSLPAYTGTIKYDDKEPVLNYATLMNLADYSRSYFLKGDDMLVSINVTDESAIVDDLGKFEVYGTFPGFASSMFSKAEECFADESSSGTWVCKWHLMNLLDGDVQASFSISDIVGNVDNSSIADPITDFYIIWNDPSGNWQMIPPGPVAVYPLNTSDDVDYWESSLESANPSFVDAETIRITGHDVWFKLKLTPRDPDNTELLAALFDPSTCGGDFDSFIDATKTYMVSSSRGSTEPWLKFAVQKNLIQKNTLKFNCTLSLISLRGGHASMPETENITLVVPVRSIGELGKQVEDEIKKVESGPLIKIGNWIDTAAKILRISESLCSIISSLQRFANSANIAAAAAIPLEGTPFAFIAHALNAISRLGQWLEKITGWSVLSVFCAFVSCQFIECGKDKKFNDKWFCKPYNAMMGDAADWMVEMYPVEITNAMGTLAQKDFIAGLYPEQASGPRATTEELSNIDASNIVFGNPKSSLILSILTLCIPGIIFNLKKARDIECTYLLCLKQQIPAGVPAFACSQMRSYQWCLFVWGEIFNLLPFAAFLKTFLSQITSILTDPGVILGLFFMGMCNYGPNSVQIGCRITDLITSVQQLLEIFQQISESEDFFDVSDTGICQQALDYEY